MLPVSLSTGMGSPLSMLSSISVVPSVTMPSMAALSPERRRIFSPVFRELAGICMSPSGVIFCTVAGLRSISRLIASPVRFLALASRVRPRRMNTIIIADDSK